MKDQLINDIFTNYKRNYAHLIMKNKVNDALSLLVDNDKANEDNFSLEVIKRSRDVTSSEALYINYVNFIYSLLTKNEKEIIYNDYIRTDVNTFWYLSKYSRSTYYRNKNKAINNFLSLYESNDKKL